MAAEKESAPATQTAPTQAPIQQPHPLPGPIFSTSRSSSGIGTKLAVTLIMILIAVLGLAIFTNPSMEDYQVFIRQQMIEKERSHANTLAWLPAGIASNLYAAQTVRNDYLLFSRYETRLGDERLVAVGVLKRFVVLQAPGSIIKSPSNVLERQSPRQVVNGTISIPPGQIKSFRFSVFSETGHISGTFSSHCDCDPGDSGIQVLIQSEEQFEIFRDYLVSKDYSKYIRDARPAHYNSLQTSSGTVNINLPKGDYVLVLANDFTAGRPSNYGKTVNASIEVF